MAQDTQDPYGLRTALLNYGWNLLVLNDYSGARDSFERVSLEDPVTRFSWWHHMEACFALGLVRIVGFGELKQGLGLVIRAQYVSGVLGLRGDVIVGVRQMLPGLRFQPSPLSTILHFGTQHRSELPLEAMREMRFEWVPQRLQNQLFRELRESGLQS